MKFINNLRDRSHQIEIRVKPNSDNFQYQIFNDSIDVWVQNRARKGKVNVEIIKEFSAILNLHSNQIRIIRGHKSSIKILEISGISGLDLKKKLSESNQLK